jgi:YHS domain-containing protein
MPCVAVFVQDPAPYLAERGVVVPCAVRPEHAAALGSGLRTRVNHENFLFSSVEAQAAFDADPLRYIDRLTDPVTRARFQPVAGGPELVHEGRTWYFASEANREVFRASPERYLEPDGMAWMR